VVLSSLPSIGVKILFAIVLILPFRFIATLIVTRESRSAIPLTGARWNLFIPRSHLNICGGVSGRWLPRANPETPAGPAGLFSF